MFGLCIVVIQTNDIEGSGVQLDPGGSTVRDDETVYWVTIGHYEAVAVVN